MKTSRAWIVLLASLFCAGHAYCAPQGELDDSFGESGRMAIQMANSRFGLAIIRQPADGKLLFPGYSIRASGGRDFAVLRLNSDGSSDGAFGSNGIAIVDFADSDSVAAKVAVQPDGKIIIVGYAEAVGMPLDFALARLNADGTIDTTFGNRGRVTVDLGGNNEFISAIVTLPSGAFVVVGTTDKNGDQDAIFARFGSSGALDPTFGTGPIAGTTIVGVRGKADELHSMIRQPDGMFVACGAASDYSELVYIGAMLAIRVDAEGAVDSAFGVNGVSLADRSPRFSAANACAAMPDGKLVLAGFGGEPGMVDPTLVRLMPDGTLDASFGSAGISRFAVSHIAWAEAIIPLEDGFLGVSGLGIPLHNTNLPTDMFFARVHSQSGALDRTFGNRGVTVVDFGSLGQSSVAEGGGLIAQPDGKLIATSHELNSRVLLARVDPYGSGSNGVAGFIATSATVSRSAAHLVVSVRRTGGSAGNLSVEYDTATDAATAPADLTPVVGTLTWLSGDVDPKSINVPLNGAGRFSIVLSNSTGGLAASKFDIQVTDDTAHIGGVGSSGGSGGGGGAIGIADLTAFALISAFALQRRRRFTRL